MKKLFPLLFIFFSINLFAQTKQKAIIKIYPLAFVDVFSFPTVQVGFEYFLSKRISVEATGGILFGKEIYHQQKGSGIKSKFELKRYFKDHPKRYLSFETSFNKLNYNTIGEFKDSIQPNGYKDSFRINKSIIGFGLKMGQQYQLTKKLNIEFYYGVGYRHKTSFQNGKLNSEARTVAIEPQLINIRDEIGKINYLNIIGGLKLGYLLW